MKFTVILTDKVASIPGLSQGLRVRVDDSLIFFTGQMGINTEFKLQDETFAVEARQALTNVKHLLAGADCTFDDVVHVSVKLSGSLDDWDELKGILKEYFGQHEPTRDLPEVVVALPANARVSISVIAAK